MRNRKAYTLLFLLSFAIGVVSYTVSNIKNVTSGLIVNLADSDCAEGLVNVEQQTNSPAQLSISKTGCGDFYSDIQLVLKNISDKTIAGYEVSNVQDYENKMGVKGAQGVKSNGIIMQPDGSAEIKVSGGFANGISYGKPVGKLKQVVIKVSHIDFADGTSWTDNEARQ